jgi:hypothetical protein
VLKPGTALADWRARMVALFGGLADMFAGCPALADRK